MAAFGLLKPFTDTHIRRLDTPGSSVEMTYLGTAGFVFKTPSRHIVVDPYVSRPSLFKQVTSRLRPNEALIESVIPNADDVLVGHAHHDHILDAPALCMQTGARLIGSVDVGRVGRAAGLPDEQILVTPGREDIACGTDSTVRGIPSEHGRVYFNRIPLRGSIPEGFKWPAYAWQFRHGDVLNWHLNLNGLRIIHVDSAQFLEEEWDGLEADVLCLCAIGRRSRPNYIADAIRLTAAKVVMACHWDCFWVPYDAPSQLMLPQVDLMGFIDEVCEHGATPLVLPIGESVTL